MYRNSPPSYPPWSTAIHDAGALSAALSHLPPDPETESLAAPGAFAGKAAILSDVAAPAITGNAPGKRS